MMHQEEGKHACSHERERENREKSERKGRKWAEKEEEEEKNIFAFTYPKQLESRGSCRAIAACFYHDRPANIVAGRP